MASTTAQQGGPPPGRPAAGPPRRPASGPGARISASLWRRSWLRATLTLTPPLAWFLVIYLASLVVMLVTAFWTVNPFTNTLVYSWTLANFQQLFTSTYLTIIGRTVGMAALVTVTDAVSLPATGADLPRPTAWMRVAGTPRVSSAEATASARRCDNA